MNSMRLPLVVLLAAVMLTSGLSGGVYAVSAENIVLGYYPAWVKDQYPAEAVDFTVLTHLIHAFAWPEKDGSIKVWDGFVYPGLVDAVHKAGRKISVAFGGWGQCEGFPPVAADPELRARFVKNAMDFCAEHGYDGIDLDWEFPANPKERDDLTLLVSDLRAAADKTGRPFLITMAISAGTWSGDHNDYAALTGKIDWYNNMTYDFYGSWTALSGPNAPLYAVQESVDTSMNFLVKKMGVPSEKLVLGLPFYGREFETDRLYGKKTGGGGVVYRNIVTRINEGWKRYWDDVSMVPYIINPEKTKVLTYDDPESIAIKCAYTKEKGFRGVMIWSVGSDYMDGRQPLLEAIGKSMGSN